MFYTIFYKNSHIHVTTYKNKESFTVQHKDYTLTKVKSLRAAKILITRRRRGTTMKIKGYDVLLIDDGTLDTVISVNGIETRFQQEYAGQFRDNDGKLSTEGFKLLAIEAIDMMI